MDKLAIFNHFSKIFDEILDSSIFMRMYLQCPYYLSPIIGKFEPSFPDNLNLYTGATRACFVDDNYKYVVKFDQYEEDEDSCKQEELIYARAQEEHLEQYLCEVAYIGTYTRTIIFYRYSDIQDVMDWYNCGIDGFEEEFFKHTDDFGLPEEINISIPLYAYQYAENYDCGCPNKIEEDIARDYKSPLKERNIAVAAAFIRTYGEDEYIRFSKFAINNRINDLHLANIGSINGNFCLIDYAGCY